MKNFYTNQTNTTIKDLVEKKFYLSHLFSKYAITEKDYLRLSQLINGRPIEQIVAVCAKNARDEYLIINEMSSFVELLRQWIIEGKTFYHHLFRPVCFNDLSSEEQERIKFTTVPFSYIREYPDASLKTVHGELLQIYECYQYTNLITVPNLATLAMFRCSRSEKDLIYSFAGEFEK